MKHFLVIQIKSNPEIQVNFLRHMNYEIKTLKSNLQQDYFRTLFIRRESFPAIYNALLECTIIT